MFASCWSCSRVCITMHGSENVNKSWFTVCCLQSDVLEFVKMLSPNKVVTLCSADLLYYVH